MAGLACACPAKPIGYSNRQGLFVCVSCNKLDTVNLPQAQFNIRSDIANLFRGGPLDGSAYATETLTSGEFDFFTNEGYCLYHVTNELVTSEATGAKARVWEYRETPFAPGKNTTTRKKAVMTENAAAAETTETETAVVTNGLQDRRKALKLSRKQVSDHSGISQAKVARIEGGGKRTTQDEVDQLAKALDELTPVDTEPADEA